MLRMDQVHVVRHKVLVEGRSQRAVARELGLARVTVRKYLDQAGPARAPELATRPRPLWEAVAPRVEALLAESVRLAWRDGVRRVQVHTCTLDHPAALGAYRRAGFVPIKRSIERFPDPRLLGILPKDCAPQVPLLGTEASAPAA